MRFDTLDRSTPLSTRFPLSPLLAAIGDPSSAQAAAQLQVSDRTFHRAKGLGLSERQADRWACAVGIHPGEVWPHLWWQDDDPERRRILGLLISLRQDARRRVEVAA